MATLPTSFTIISDTREQHPLKFPTHLTLLNPLKPPHARDTRVVSLHVIEKKLDIADYMLEGDKGAVYEAQGIQGCGVVERKMSLRELAVNCLDEKRSVKFDAQLAKMRERWVYPCLLLEADFRIWNVPAQFADQPALVHDALQRLCLRHNVSLQFCPAGTITARLVLGEWTARWLINATLLHNGLYYKDAPVGA